MTLKLEKAEEFHKGCISHGGLIVPEVNYRIFNLNTVFSTKYIINWNY